MKKLVLFTSAIIALAFSCAKEDQIQVAQNSKLTITASIEQTTKATVNYNKILWSANDQIAVYNGSGFTSFTLSAGSGTGNGSFTQDSGDEITPQGIAVFPESIKGSYTGGETTVSLPDVYPTFVTNGLFAPMLATIEGNSVADLQFRPMTGFVRLGYESLADNAAYFIISTPGRKINGEFSVKTAEDGTKVIETEETTNESLTFVKIPVGDGDKNYSFVAALPVGEYPLIEMYLADENSVPIDNTLKQLTDETVSRLDLLSASFGFEAQYKLTYDPSKVVPLLSSNATSLSVACKMVVTFLRKSFSEDIYIARAVSKSTFVSDYMCSVAKYAASIDLSKAQLYNKDYNLTMSAYSPDIEYIVIMLGVDVDGEGKATGYNGRYGMLEIKTPSYNDMTTKLTINDVEYESLADFWVGSYSVPRDKDGNETIAEEERDTWTIEKKDGKHVRIKGINGHTGSNYIVEGFINNLGTLYVYCQKTGIYSTSDPNSYIYLTNRSSSGYYPYSSSATVFTAKLNKDMSGAVLAKPTAARIVMSFFGYYKKNDTYVNGGYETLAKSTVLDGTVITPITE